ncbi:MAG: hypothetical protein ACQKBY_04860 [Verrucomicrobiales bacterium]
MNNTALFLFVLIIMSCRGGNDDLYPIKGKSIEVDIGSTKVEFHYFIWGADDYVSPILAFDRELDGEQKPKLIAHGHRRKFSIRSGGSDIFFESDYNVFYIDKSGVVHKGLLDLSTNEGVNMEGAINFVIECRK